MKNKKKVPHSRNNNKKYHTVGTITKSKRKIVEIDWKTKIPPCRNNSKFKFQNRYTNTLPLISWLGTGTSI